MKTVALLGAWAFLWCAITGAQEDSLRSALSAVDKRQRYLNRFADDALSAYTYSDDSNLEFLIPEDKSYSYYPPTFSDRALLDYLQGEDPFRNERKKSISSPFRERVEKDRERQREQFAKLLLTSLNSGRDDGVIYGEMTDDFIDEQPKTSRYYKESLRKRGNKYYQPESLSDPFYALSTLPRDEIEDDDIYYGERNNDIFTHHKRFPVSKRSSSEYDFTNLRKRSPNKEPNKKTDPKVEKELSNIFGPPKKEENKTKPAERKKQGLQKANTKEVAAPVISKSEPFEIKKKSIDWSDYFGLDRRKKSDSDLDKEWLMERYHKAVSMTAKRSNEYPLKHFHNHDQPQTNQEARHQQQQQQEKIKNEQPKTEEAKIKEIDEKLKNIEDAIVDDALKYTGAHEGTTDSKEAQEVKDRVISRLAAAYSLEKMRRALGEYKLSIAKERNRLKQAGNSDDYLFSEEKRVSVPRKQAIDEEAEKTQNIDNSIKCKGDNCNYKVPSRILDQYQWGTEECPKIQRECNDLAASTGKYSRTFEIACNIHQLCLLCDDNSWFTPTLRCSALYLAKANELCGGNAECQKTAQYSLENLLLLNRSLRDFPLDGCNIICPENER